MKGYLIDPQEKTITEVDVDMSDGLKAVYKLLDCRLVEAVYLNEAQDCVFVNEEGLMDGTIDTYGMFLVTGTARSVPLAGRGVVLGFDPDQGASADVQASIDSIRAMVSFRNQGASIDRRI